MKMFFTLLLLGSNFTECAAAGAHSKKVEKSHFKSEKYGFEFDYPKSWSLQPSFGKCEFVWLNFTTSQKATATLGITFSPRIRSFESFRKIHHRKDSIDLKVGNENGYEVRKNECGEGEHAEDAEACSVSATYYSPSLHERGVDILLLVEPGPHHSVTSKNFYSNSLVTSDDFKKIRDVFASFRFTPFKKMVDLDPDCPQ